MEITPQKPPSWFSLHHTATTVAVALAVLAAALVIVYVQQYGFSLPGQVEKSPEVEPIGEAQKPLAGRHTAMSNMDLNLAIQADGIWLIIPKP